MQTVLRGKRPADDEPTIYGATGDGFGKGLLSGAEARPTPSSGKALDQLLR